MKILIDTREQDPLDFYSDVETERRTIEVGDYAPEIDGDLIPIRIERKSIADLFGSFAGGYENEKAKIDKARSLDLRYILAIEGTAFDVREGHQYRKDGEIRSSKKDGLSQIKQIYTMYHKGYFHDIWWCRSRAEMSFMIYHYFLAVERNMEKTEGKT